MFSCPKQPISYLSRQSMLTFFSQNNFTSHQYFMSIIHLFGKQSWFYFVIMTGWPYRIPSTVITVLQELVVDVGPSAVHLCCLLLIEFYDITLSSHDFQVHRPTAHHCKEGRPQWGALCKSTVYSTDADGVWWRYAQPPPLNEEEQNKPTQKSRERS